MSGAIMDYPPDDWLDHKSGQVIDSSRPKANRRCEHGYLQKHSLDCDPVEKEEG